MTTEELSLLARRSPVYRQLVEDGAVFSDIGSGVVATHLSERAVTEVEQVRSLGLCDLTLCARVGYKGWAAIEWARGVGIKIGEQNNRAYMQSDGSRVVRLSDTEILIPGELSELPSTIGVLAAAPEMEGVYLVPRTDSNCRFVICGDQSSVMLAKLCGVDLRPRRFYEGNVAQTSVARLNTIIIRNDLGTIPCYDLMTDIASAGYMWGCLMDAMFEFEGHAVGTSALCSLKEDQ